MSERTESLTIDKLHCARCAQEIEETLEKMQGVRDATVLLGPSKVQILYEDEVLNHDALVASLDQMGHRVVHLLDLEEKPWWRRWEVVSTVLSGAFLLLGIFVQFATADPALSAWGNWVFHASGIFYLTAVALGAARVVRAGVRAVMDRRFGVDLLMGIAVLGAVILGELFEAASLAFLFALAELLEDYAVDRARHSLRALLQLAPQQATVLRDGLETVVPVAEVALDEIVIVHPGEKVSVDGVVMFGASSVNQSPITGESLPIEKSEGDPVYAGSLNQEGVLHVRTSKGADDSTLAKIIHLVEQAETEKAPTERFMDQFGRYYTPAVVGLAVAVAVLPPLFLGQPWHDWVLRALTLLVISCPCALLISTPVSVVSAITAAARHGVLIKGGVYLEALGRAKAVAFDKTGTLTTGHLEVQEVIPLNGMTPGQVLHLAASLEAASHHPVAQAIVATANETPLLPIEKFRSLTGQGVEGELNGTRYRVGKRELFPDTPAARFRKLHGEGKLAVVVGSEQEAFGIIAVRDRVRPEAKAAVKALKDAGLAVVMLTGDHGDIAKAVAEELGVDHYRSSVMPDQKLDEIKKLEAQYGPVIMVGDGVNDAPALAAASVGVAMGAAGTDTALETADVALLGDDLSKLPYLIRLSRRARRVIGQNVGVSIAVKGGLALGAVFGAVSLILAVLLGDMGATLAVTGNALRLGRVKPDEEKPPG